MRFMVEMMREQEREISINYARGVGSSLTMGQLGRSY